MKIKSFFMLLATIVCAAACSDNKENLVSVADIAGQYEGYAVANCAYFQNSVSEGESITISENTDGSAKVTFVSETWGEITVDNAQPDKNGDKYTLSGSGKATMGMGGNTSSNDCTLTSEILSTDDARLLFSVPAVMGGLTIEFITGEAPEDLTTDK